MSSVAEELVKDKDVRRGVVHVASDAYSGFKTAMKVIGIAIGAGILFLVGKKVVKSIKKSNEEKKEQEALEEEVKKNKAKIVHSDSWFLKAVQELKTAMNTKDGYKDGYFSWMGSSYDNSKITTVLKALKNQYEWDELVLKFNKIDEHDLKDWLGLDDDGDVKAYNLILSNLGVDEINLIPDSSLSLFGTDLLQLQPIQIV